MRNSRALIATALALACLVPAQAQDSRLPLWHVTADGGEIWMLGAIHVLPSALIWQTAQLRRIMDKTDTFVFEAPIDDAATRRLQDLMRTQGQLPQGQSLRDLLPPASQSDFDAVIDKTHLRRRVAEAERPWLLSLQLLDRQILDNNLSPRAGVDPQIMRDATYRRKDVHYLETVDQQFALLAPQDPAVELEELESNLSAVVHDDHTLLALETAWEDGDTATIQTLIQGELGDHPRVRDILIGARNRAWAQQIEAMLKEHKRIFITVGVGHLVGDDGLPALLRKAGYTVEGP